MTLALEAAVIAGGIFLGRQLARVVRRRREERAARLAKLDAYDDDDDESVERATGSEGDNESDGDGESANDDVLEGFVCRLGDVVLRRVEGDEAWLAGALVFTEDRPVAALFVGPEARGERGVFVAGPAQSALAWLAPVAAGELTLIAPGGDPPRALEHHATCFKRTRRLPVRVERFGAGAPRVGKRAILGEYAAGAQRLLVIAGSDAAVAWRGVALAEGEYDVLPGGTTTLEP